jgi:TRAP-type C4-dicarboxylate transport system substrate-binding protein
MVEVYKKANVKVVTMNADQYLAWRKIADQTSYKVFAEKVPGGKELLDKALSVK